MFLTVVKWYKNKKKKHYLPIPPLLRKLRIIIVVQNLTVTLENMAAHRFQNLKDE